MQIINFLIRSFGKEGLLGKLTCLTRGIQYIAPHQQQTFENLRYNKQNFDTANRRFSGKMAAQKY